MRFLFLLKLIVGVWMGGKVITVEKPREWPSCPPQMLLVLFWWSRIGRPCCLLWRQTDGLGEYQRLSWPKIFGFKTILPLTHQLLNLLYNSGSTWGALQKTKEFDCYTSWSLWEKRKIIGASRKLLALVKLVFNELLKPCYSSKHLCLIQRSQTTVLMGLKHVVITDFVHLPQLVWINS